MQLSKVSPKMALITGAALVASTAAALGGAGMAGATTRPAGPAAAPAITSLPSTHVQQAINQNVAIAAGNTHTILATSPVLPQGNYLVDLTISFNNLTPGAQVLCGTNTTASTDVDAGNYGDVQNEGATATTGSCSVISAVEINNTNDRVQAWATVFQGPGGPAAYSWTMSELRVGNLVIN
jgi:hypothetical protein